jgi:hypothetical protein
MKIAVCSDLHLEFGSLTLKNPGGVDVLILSGDILVERDLDEWNLAQVEAGFALKRSTMYHTFFQECAKEFPYVLYVAGNHEHYHGDFKHTLSNLKSKFAYLENVHVLDRDVFKVDDFVFVGGTLWTDMNKEDPQTLYHIKSAMNDFRCVDNSNQKFYRKVPLYKKGEDGTYLLDENGRYIEDGMKMKEEIATFSPKDAVEDHRKMVDYIRTVYEGMPPWESMIVVGHHAPSKASTHPRYIHDTLMNGGYSSELSEFILDRPGIKLWTHGHTHEDFDYMIGECRIVCNPRGYIGHETRANDFKLKVVEL